MNAPIKQSILTLAILGQSLITAPADAIPPASPPVVRTAPATTTAAIPEAVSNDQRTPPPPVDKPDFRIRSTHVKRIHVVQAPEMPDLPQVEGNINVTVHRVDDPNLADPPTEAPSQILDPDAQSRLTAMTENNQPTRIAFVSATVYDNHRTLLHCYSNSNPDKVITAWSNLDFNHFTGFGSFLAEGADGGIREYSLLMGIGNENTDSQRNFMTARGFQYQKPDIPTIPDGQPAFIILTPNPDPAGVTLIEDLHALYRSEGLRMAAECAARNNERETRKAYLLAHPPAPDDVTIHFWKRKYPIGARPQTSQPDGNK